MKSEPFIGWLQGLINNRISSNLTLAVTHQDQPTYRLIFGDKYIEMPKWHWGLGKDVSACARIDLSAEGLSSDIHSMLPAPGVDELPVAVIEIRPHGYLLHYDVLGLAYWMLSRAEEVGREDLDDLQRFPAVASHAFLHDYLDRPVVDEWFSILRELTARVWPTMPLVIHQFKLELSHDVDRPSAYALMPFRKMIRNVCGDLLKRRDITAALRRPLVWSRSVQQLHAADPFNTFDWLMQLSEQQGVTSVFNFVAGVTSLERDPGYDINHPVIRNLLVRIHSRSHSIGLHPSFETFRDPNAIAREADVLRGVCNSEGVLQERWGARMHYLRWSTPVTQHGLELADLNYDSTLGYADYPGFRCGTCMSYTAIDPITYLPLKLEIRPLIAMDCTVIDKSYMGLGISEEAAEVFLKLKRVCQKMHGSFSLLWHNSQLTSAGERRLYQKILDS